MMTLFLLQEMALNEVLAFLQKSSIKVETSRTVEQFGEFKIFGGIRQGYWKKIMLLFCISCKVQSKYSIEVIFIVCRSIQKNLINVLMGECYYKLKSSEIFLNESWRKTFYYLILGTWIPFKSCSHHVFAGICMLREGICYVM